MHPLPVAVDRGAVVAAGADKDVALEKMPGYFTCRTTCVRHWRLRICQVCQVSSLLLRAATGDVLVATAQVPSYRTPSIACQRWSLTPDSSARSTAHRANPLPL